MTTLADIQERLRERGWLAPDADEIAVRQALREFQDLHELEVDGVAGPVTERYLNQQSFCGCSEPDLLEARRRPRLRKWNKQELTIRVAGELPGLRQADFEEAIVESFRGWSRVANIQAELTDSRSADLVVTTRRLDGRNGTLADQQLPNGDDRPLQMRIDTSELWTIAEQMHNGRIDALRVIRHEWGHGIGISHLREGNLMQPFVSARIRDVQNGDIQEARRRYGPAVNRPDPPTIKHMWLHFEDGLFKGVETERP